MAQVSKTIVSIPPGPFPITVRLIADQSKGTIEYFADILVPGDLDIANISLTTKQGDVIIDGKKKEGFITEIIYQAYSRTSEIPFTRLVRFSDKFTGLPHEFIVEAHESPGGTASTLSDVID